MKQVTINKFSETIEKITLTDKQRKLVGDLLNEMSELSYKLKKEIGISKNILLLPLLLIEGESTSLIEGTRTMFEDFSFDIEEMDNIPQWETRNLISLYEKYLLSDYYLENFIFSTGTIQNMHIDFFRNDPNSKFKMTFDTTKRIKQVAPGKIMSDDSVQNFIGSTGKVEDATLMLLQPSLKKEYLDDLTETIQFKLEKEELLLDHLFISHPIFEAIHPFRDGNGRIGRLLLSLMFAKIFPRMELPLYISEALYERDEEYKEKLLKVQSSQNNDFEAWNDWNAFFIDCLISMKRKLSLRVNNIIELFKEAQKTKAFSTNIRKYIASAFFKYYKINKRITLKSVQRKYPDVSIQTIYNDFNIVLKELDIESKGGDYFAFTKLLKKLKV